MDYVNARPHIGHAFEKVVADVVARWHRLRGYDVRFLTGTDENAQKNYSTALQEHCPVRELVDRNASAFIALCKCLNISYDKFIRTTDPVHKQVVQDIFRKLYNKGEITKGTYKGFYCEGCESFITSKELINGGCPEHKTTPKTLSEECYFFKIDKYRDELLHFLEYRVFPKFRANEVVERIKSGPLIDVCVSRPYSGWGISSPIGIDGFGLPEQTIYVWFDALLSYLTGSDCESCAGYFPGTHLIGKGINWFHTAVWPAMLLAADYPLPKRVVIHGYLNQHGEKISKSNGNIIDPFELIDKYGTDAVRYSLLRRPIFHDATYSEDLLVEHLNKELANKLGNLISRSTTLAAKIGLETSNDYRLSRQFDIQTINLNVMNFELDKALVLIFDFVDKCNEFVNETKPWETKDKKILYELMNSIKELTVVLSPFLPDTCSKIATSMGFPLTWNSIGVPLLSVPAKIPPLFPRVS